MNTSSAPSRPLTTSRIVETWWPLAASWILMSLELPALSAVVARLANPEIHLAAYGSVAFPLALLIEAPIIMLLAASTALSKDWSSYETLRGYMMKSGAALTLLHVVVAFTPLFDFIVGDLMGVPEPIVGPSKIGFQIMTPWTWSIAYRRFNQGVLIRFGRSRVVTRGTAVRLLSLATVLTIGYGVGTFSGTVVASAAVATGVIAEAVFIGFRVKPVLRNQVHGMPESDPLTLSIFLYFYIPLALTSLLNLFIQPFGSAAIARMPMPVESLAVWPVVYGFVFLMRSLGLAYQEVVVALIERPQSYPRLQKFALMLTAVTTLGLVVVAGTPLSPFWFGTVSGLPQHLLPLAETGLWVAFLLPGLGVMKNWYQGVLVHHRKTRRITESVVIFLIVCGGLLWAGAEWATVPGLYVGFLAFSAGALFQVLWLGYWAYRVRTEGEES